MAIRTIRNQTYILDEINAQSHKIDQTQNLAWLFPMNTTLEIRDQRTHALAESLNVTIIDGDISQTEVVLLVLHDFLADHLEVTRVQPKGAEFRSWAWLRCI